VLLKKLKFILKRGFKVQRGFTNIYFFAYQNLKETMEGLYYYNFVGVQKQTESRDDEKILSKSSVKKTELAVLL
jgi:hypothetical protein